MGWRSGQSYSQDLLDRVMGAVDSGMVAWKAEAVFKLSVAYIYKALIRRRLTGNSKANLVRGRPPRKLSPKQEQALEAHIRSRPGITLAQACRIGPNCNDPIIDPAIDRMRCMQARLSACKRHCPLCTTSQHNVCLQIIEKRLNFEWDLLV